MDYPSIILLLFGFPSIPSVILLERLRERRVKVVWVKGGENRDGKEGEKRRFEPPLYLWRRESRSCVKISAGCPTADPCFPSLLLLLLVVVVAVVVVVVVVILLVVVLFNHVIQFSFTVYPRSRESIKRATYSSRRFAC